MTLTEALELLKEQAAWYHHWGYDRKAEAYDLVIRLLVEEFCQPKVNCECDSPGCTHWFVNESRGSGQRARAVLNWFPDLSSRRTVR